MNKTTAWAFAAATSIGLVAGCGEASQTPAGSSVGKSDMPAYQGAAEAYVAQGWKVGDKSSWEQHMRDRMQGQNEYARTAAAKQ